MSDQETAAALVRNAFDILNVLASSNTEEWLSKEQIKPGIVEARDDLRAALRLLAVSSPASEDVRERIIAELDKHELVYQGQSAHLTDAALSAIRPGDDLGNRTMAVQAGSRVKHINRGSTYRVLDAAKIQSSTPLRDGATVVVYRSEADGRLWARDYSEMHDGRFEVLAVAKEKTR